MFDEDDNESSSLRQLFFHNTVHNTVAEGSRILLDTLQTLVNSAECSDDREQADILKEVRGRVQDLYGQTSLPSYPHTLTDDQAWSTLREAWADKE